VSLIELGAGFHPELTGRERALGGGLFDRRAATSIAVDEIVQFRKSSGRLIRR
jgi:ABC-type polysaccharide/polyol phosphate transport system ATPase subunit